MLYDDYRKEKMLALKNKDSEKNKVLTNLLSAMTYAKKEKGGELNEADCQAIVQKLYKQAQESYHLADGRPDIQEGIAREKEIIASYLPAQLSEAEIQEKLEEIFAASGLTREPKSKGQLMKLAMGALKGQADGKVIAHVVDAWIQGA